MISSSTNSTTPVGLIDFMGRLRAQGRIPDGRKCVDAALALAHQEGFPGATRHQVKMALKALKHDRTRMAKVGEERARTQHSRGWVSTAF